MPALVRTVLLAVTALLLAASAAQAQAGADPDAYGECETAGDAMFVEVSRASCDDARAVAVAITAAAGADLQTAIAPTGWTPLRVRGLELQQAYDIYATRGTATLRIRRRGDTPDLDGWMAGRELVFSSGTLVAGGSIPRDTTLCTSAFLVRLGTRLGGLSAAHCAGTTKAGLTRRHNSALRRAPQPGIILGGVRRNLARRRPPTDVLVLPVPSGPNRPAANVIERFSFQPPLFVRGRARPLLGRTVCFSGVTSGANQCGKIVRRFPGARGLSCTTIVGREGDSGSPVYTAPAADGTVRAVGIANVVFSVFQFMCFVPIDRVLDELHATLVSAVP
ncbi:MAG: hypothetical protein QOJ89_4457 [bacterium]